MTVLRTITLEVIHLFVDNGSLALALVLWCAVVRLAVAFLTQSSAVLGPALFFGCAVVLLVNILNAARAQAVRKTP
jgi:hypothetical protein